MVKNPFLYFSFLPSENKGDSSLSLMDRSNTMIPEKFSKHGFSLFFQFDPFFHLVSIDLKFFDVISRKLHTHPKTTFLRLSVEKLSYKEKSWFSKKKIKYGTHT